MKAKLLIYKDDYADYAFMRENLALLKEIAKKNKDTYILLSVISNDYTEDDLINETLRMTGLFDKKDRIQMSPCYGNGFKLMFPDKKYILVSTPFCECDDCKLEDLLSETKIFFKEIEVILI